MRDREGLENYPVADALQAIDTFTLGQEGEPQRFTFGETIRHWSWLAIGKPDKYFGHYRRKLFLISTYGDMEEMTADLRDKSMINLEISKERQKMAYEQSEHDPPLGGPLKLPLTTAEEKSLDDFEADCLPIDEIRDAAEQRAARDPLEDAPKLIIRNAETDESQTITFDAAKLIGEGALQVTRGRNRGYRRDDVVISTTLELGEFFKHQAQHLGLDVDNVAIEGKWGKGYKLFSSDGHFSSHPSIANDFWTADEVYSKSSEDPSGVSAPPRHSLSTSNDGYHRTDDYDTDDILNAAQAKLTEAIAYLHGFCGGGVLSMQQVRPLDQAFYDLMEAVTGTKRFAPIELGYSYVLTTLPESSFIATRVNDGWAAEHLDFNYDKRIAAENSFRQFEHWRKPAIKKLAGFVTRQFSGSRNF